MSNRLSLRDRNRILSGAPTIKRVRCVSEKSKRELLSKLGNELRQDLLGVEDLPKRNHQSTTNPKKQENLKVLSWGSGSSGQLGHSDQRYRLRPTLIRSLQQIPGSSMLSGISSGDLFSIAMTSKGEVYFWGTLCNRVVQHPERLSFLSSGRVVSIACGTEHVAFVTLRGALHTMGNGSGGRLGHGVETSFNSPKPVEALRGDCVLQAACGEEHTLIRTKNNEIFSFGVGRGGQLGLGDKLEKSIPEKVEKDLFKNSEITQISCGRYHSAMVLSNGNVFSWGWGEYGRLGHGNEEKIAEPKVIDFFAKKALRVDKVSCGGSHTLFLTSNSQVYSCGWGVFGQLGIKNCKGSLIPRLVKELKDQDIVELVGGYAHSAALSGTGKLYTWGFGEEGQLGIGTELDIHEPQEIKLKNMLTFSIALGRAHTIALVSKNDKETVSRIQEEKIHEDASHTIQNYFRICMRRKKKARKERDFLKLRNAHKELYWIRLQKDLSEYHFQMTRSNISRQLELQKQFLEAKKDREKQEKLRFIVERKREEKIVSAIKIQAQFRRFTCRRKFLEYTITLKEREMAEKRREESLRAQETHRMAKEDATSFKFHHITNAVAAEMLRHCIHFSDCIFKHSLDKVERIFMEPLEEEQLRKARAKREEFERRRKEEEQKRREQALQLLEKRKQKHEEKLKELSNRLSKGRSASQKTAFGEVSACIELKKSKPRKKKNVIPKPFQRQLSSKQANETQSNYQTDVKTRLRAKSAALKRSIPDRKTSLVSPRVAEVRQQRKILTRLERTGPNYLFIPGQQQPQYKLDSSCSDVSSSNDEKSTVQRPQTKVIKYHGDHMDSSCDRVFTQRKEFPRGPENTESEGQINEKSNTKKIDLQRRLSTPVIFNDTANEMHFHVLKKESRSKSFRIQSKTSLAISIQRNPTSTNNFRCASPVIDW